MVDRSVIVQIFGCLMKRPQYLSESDKYTLTPKDFYYRLDKYIFVAIENLYRSGAIRIQPIDVENYLSSNKTAKVLFDQNNTIEFLQDAEFLTNELNFPYYYLKLKKFNLLTTFQEMGFDTSEFYIEDLMNPKAAEVNKHFEELSLTDIIDSVKKKYILIESEFIKQSVVESWEVSADIADLVAGFGDESLIGLPINGEIISQAINGAELGALTIRSGSTGTGKTRYAIGDACKLAYPFTYNWDKKKWMITGHDEQVLFVATEQQPTQIEKMILAYLTGINESKFKYANFTDEERKILQEGVKIIQDYPNLHLLRIPDPNVELIKVLIREQIILHDVKYVFFDYIFASNALYKEYRGHNLRTDEALLLLSTALKDIAIEHNISIFSATQLNAKGDDGNNIRNESALSGSRAIANKVDNGMIIARPTKEDIEFFEKEGWKIPNRVVDIYKTRSTPWNYIRVWSYFDAGTCRNQDLFVTDARYNIVSNFFENEFVIQWESDEKDLLYLENLNK